MFPRQSEDDAQCHWRGKARNVISCSEEATAMDVARVKDVMTSEVTVLRRDEQLTLADDLMHLGRIRHLPILDEEGKRVVGLVTQRDLFRGALAQAIGYGERARRKLLESLLIVEVMTAHPITTTPETPLAEAARVLMERKIGCLPVIENDRLVGILTEGDFVALYAKEGQK
jgi:CBS domain-containing membrane protein